MADHLITSEQRGTTTSSDTIELVVSEAVIRKGMKPSLLEDRSDEPDIQGLFRQLSQRFENHEATIRADIASLKADLTEQLVASVSNCIVHQEQQIERLRKDLLNLTDGLSAQDKDVRALKDSIQDGFTALHASTTSLHGDVCALRNTLDNRLSIRVSNAFPQFRALPSEIRCMVWEWATTGKILEIHELEQDELELEEPFNYEYLREFEFIGNRSPPATAQVCRESRKIACRDGKLVSIENRQRRQPRDGQSYKTTSYESQWAWFNSRKDTLYLNTRCSSFHRGYVSLLKNVRHFILEPPTHQQKLGELLEPGVCPQLTSIQLIFGLLEWPVRQDLEFEGSLWSNGSHHLAVKMIEGDSAEAKRVYADLRERLSPRCGKEARTSLRRLFTASGGDGVDFDDYATRALPGRRLEKLMEMAERSMLGHVWLLALVPEHRQGCVRLWSKRSITTKYIS
ncbi:hypothetical protein GQX73_g1903 [Xylaria multiplex]|uniref:2EXR domain-containing protein n=1 Tax=Xylaria multiplex TaxID=323545 RepID=A0A7C8MVW9_9PEZI|nr:hypothetical protein GQX73_g1903 [Xylaria multiplex]